MEYQQSLWLLLAAPAVGALLCAGLHLLSLRGRSPHAAESPSGANAPPPGPLARLAAITACSAMLVAFALAISNFASLHELPAAERVLASSAWDWISVGNFQVQLSLIFDPLSSVLCLVICGVGFLIHVYSAGYMKGDPGYAKFFAFLNLFVFAMLLLVLSSSLLGLFIGWEGVGLASYLLIGFWYAKGWPADAAQKAFVVNRIGDACFLIGSFLLVRLFGTLDLSDLSNASIQLVQSGESRTQLALAAVFLFGGACGKSAQLPLFTWLPDAMAGPTPVSALIHAATMVTAGIYLLTRLNPLYASSPALMLFIACVGALTALIGATTALCQRDIKKVLAYSTVSQLGFMFLALGSGAFNAAIFHLVTHAFFKGLLFLGAGSVIHGMHEEQDMHKMGGLRKYMPRTHFTFLAGAAALSGMPLMSGYFSKDEILASTLLQSGPYVLLWLVGLLAAACTAFYTWRMVALTFYGEERFDANHVHPHESPASMTVPLIVLAVLSVAGGLLNLPHILPLHGVLAHWLDPVTHVGTEWAFGSENAHGVHHFGTLAEILLLVLGAAIAMFFAHHGFHTYKRGTDFDDSLNRKRPGLTALFGNAWGIDSAYQSKIVKPIMLAAYAIATIVDQFVIDGIVNGSAVLANRAGTSLRGLADGSIKSYALWIGAGSALIALFWMWS